MVKGITKRVIVIKSPDKRLFDEAIFIVREDALSDTEIKPGDIVKQAQKAADDYIKNHLSASRRFKIPAPFFTLLGAGITALIWLVAVTII